MQKDGAQFFLIAAHPVIPKMMKLRNGEFEVLAQRAANSRLPVVLAGDLNCSPWSYYFDKLLADGQLVDSERGAGIQRSWPTRVLERIGVPAFIPLDHFLVSKNFFVVSREIGQPDGSDHLPVFIEVALNARSPDIRQTAGRHRNDRDAVRDLKATTKGRIAARE